jgi:hypothetical protein
MAEYGDNDIRSNKQRAKLRAVIKPSPDPTPRQMIADLRQCARFIRDKTTAPEHIVIALYQAAQDLEFWEDTHIHRLGDWPNRLDL